jgi:serine/threonine-protein kinase
MVRCEVAMEGAQARWELPKELGRYRLIAEIAAGGAAVVYAAALIGRAGFQRTVAIKVLHAHLADDPDFVAMFLDEARLSARIHHPNVVDVLDVDVLEDRLVIVMEWVDGVPLSVLRRAAHKRGRPLPIGVASRVVHDALLGLHAAHELRGPGGAPLGLVHRDVTPHNLLVGADGISRASDFGVAKASGRIAKTDSNRVVKGKLRYLAPEQAQGLELDRRVDVFAAGIVLWEALAGRTLFDGDTDAEVLSQILGRPIEPPSKHRREVPPELDEICGRALARAPGERFPDAAAFATALEATLGPVLAPQRRVAEAVEDLARAELARVRSAVQAADAAHPRSPDASQEVEAELARRRLAPLIEVPEQTRTTERVSLATRSTSRHVLRRPRWTLLAAGAACVIAAVAFLLARGSGPGQATVAPAPSAAPPAAAAAEMPPAESAPTAVSGPASGGGRGTAAGAPPTVRSSARIAAPAASPAVLAPSSAASSAPAQPPAPAPRASSPLYFPEGL